MRILFVTANRIGDAILSTGILSHLIERHPDARLTIACGAPAAPLLAAVPNLETLWVVRKQPYHMHWGALWAHCVTRHWDIVVDLRGSALAWMVPARRRHVWRQSQEGVHRVEALGRVLGLSSPPAPQIWTSDADRQQAEQLVPNDRPVLSIGPTANWRAKQWRGERFGDLARALTAPDGPFPDAAVAVSGAEQERAQVQPVFDALADRRVIDLVGASLPLTYECFRRSHFYVGNDSGLTHLAAASGTPTLALFGPTRNDHYAPWGRNAAVVRTPESFAEHVGAADFDHRTSDTLMDGLTVDTVMQSALELIARVGRRAAS